MRITEGMFKLAGLIDIQTASKDLQITQRKLATGREIEKPSDDPLRFTAAARMKSLVRQREQDLRSVTDTRRSIENVEAAVDRLQSLFQRLRVLVLQAGNESHTTADLRLIASEMRAGLEELIQTANSGDAGAKIFGGAETSSAPFEIVRDAAGDVTNVIYRGDDVARLRPIGEGEEIQINFVGSKLFQVDGDRVDSSLTVANTTATLASQGFPVGDSTGYFEVQGKRIYFDTASDSLQDIVDRINSDSPAVTASISGTGPFALRITTNTPDQLFLSDVGTGSFLQRLGITDGTSNAPANVVTAQETDLDMFEMLMNTIENLDDGDFAELRDERLGEFDRAIANLQIALGDTVARRSTVEIAEGRAQDVILQAKSAISANEDLDLGEAIADLQRQQLKLQTAIGALGNFPFPNLLQYL